MKYSPTFILLLVIEMIALAPLAWHGTHVKARSVSNPDLSYEPRDAKREVDPAQPPAKSEPPVVVASDFADHPSESTDHPSMIESSRERPPRALELNLADSLSVFGDQSDDAASSEAIRLNDLFKDEADSGYGFATPTDPRLDDLFDAGGRAPR